MLQLTINDQATVSVSQEDGKMILNNAPVHWDAAFQPNGLISVLYNGKSFTGMVEGVDRKTKEVTLRINGQPFTITVKEPIDQLLGNMGLDLKAMKKAEPVKAPMPGMVLRILVAPGQQVQKGDGLIILEAMKMENVLKAAVNATIKAIRVTERTAVEKGAILIELE